MTTQSKPTDWYVRRVYCVGQNYAAHAREMGFDPTRESPFFFGKPGDAVFCGDVPYPSRTQDFQHEVELVVAIGRGGSDLSPQAAMDYVAGYAIGIDWTRRDLQIQARKLGRPWEVSKGFDYSASFGKLHPVAATGELKSGRIWLAVNGVTRQDSDLSQLIWKVPEIIAELSTFVRLEAGDLIFTGTPEGVGPVQIGDQITAGIDGLGTLSLQVVPRAA